MFEAFLDGPCADGPGVLATSGKALRRSFDRAAGRAPLHVVTGRRCTDRPGLPGLAMIACVPSGRQIGESTARRFHVSPARLTSKAVAKAAGTRWLIGNSPYRVLDVAFDEDRARNRKGQRPGNPQPSAQAPPSTSCEKPAPNSPSSARRKRAGWSGDFARTILGQMGRSRAPLDRPRHLGYQRAWPSFISIIPR